MTFDINQFKGVINSVNGLSKASRFRAIIIPSFSLGDIRTLSFLCDQATLPGISWTTSDIRPTGYGNFVKRPTNATFADVNLSFFVDNKSNVMSFFHQWMARINHFDKSAFGTRNGIPLYQFNYPEEYYAKTIIQTFDDEENVTTEITLTDSYPVSLGEIQMSWDAQSTLVKATVTMAYDSWSSNHFDESTTDRSSSFTSTNDFSEAPISRRQTGRTTEN